MGFIIFILIIVGLCVTHQEQVTKFIAEFKEVIEEVSQENTSSNMATKSVDVEQKKAETKARLKEHFGIEENKIHNEIHANENGHIHEGKDISCRANASNNIFDEDKIEKSVVKVKDVTSSASNSDTMKIIEDLIVKGVSFSANTDISSFM